MKTNKTVNVICSLVVLALLIIGMIYLIKEVGNQSVVIIGSIIMGILGLSVAAFIVKELFTHNKPMLNPHNENEHKKCSKSCNVWMTIIYIISVIIIVGLCIYFFTSSSRVNYIIGIIALACLVIYTIYYIIQRNRH